MMNACENFYVAAGFREDCMELISQFEKLDDLKFQNFCKIWNNMKFSCVFSGRATHSELVEFAEEALDIAKEFISPNKSYKAKIGGIYLLYGLFFTMPVSQPKIRMIDTEWQNVIELQREIYHDKEYEAIYILKQLIEKNAFAHVCSEHERGLENYYLLKDFMRGNPRVTQSQRKENEWTKIFDDIAMTNQLYLTEKQKLAKFSANLVPKVFDMDEDKKLMDTIKKLENVNSNTSSSPSNESVMLSNSPSTSRDVNSYRHRIKLDSGDDTDSSDESDDEDAYQL